MAKELTNPLYPKHTLAEKFDKLVEASSRETASPISMPVRAFCGVYGCKSPIPVDVDMARRSVWPVAKKI